MKILVKQIINFPTFYETVKNQKLPLKISYKLARLSKAAENELEFYQTKFQEYLQLYALTDAEGNFVPTADGRGVRLIPGQERECQKAITELENLEIEIPDLYFSLDDFEEISLTPQEFEIILPFIQE